MNWRALETLVVVALVLIAMLTAMYWATYLPVTPATGIVLQSACVAGALGFLIWTGSRHRNKA
jgi:hypothetical protein